jgi:hypothetical protein
MTRPPTPNPAATPLRLPPLPTQHQVAAMVRIEPRRLDRHYHRKLRRPAPLEPGAGDPGTDG